MIQGQCLVRRRVNIQLVAIDVCKHMHKHMCIKQKPERVLFSFYKQESCYSIRRCNHKPRTLRWTTLVVSFKGRQNKVCSVWTFMLLQKNKRLSRLSWTSQLHSQRQQSCCLYCQRGRSLRVHLTAPVQPQPTAQQGHDILTIEVFLTYCNKKNKKTKQKKIQPHSSVLKPTC